MLKREVPTGPAVDLLRELLEEVEMKSALTRKVGEFLAGTPAHTPLPLTARGNASAADLLRPNGSVFLADMKPADAELVKIAVNNFYALRDAALAYFELDRCGDAGGLMLAEESRALFAVLTACGAEVSPGLTPAQAQQAYAGVVLPNPAYAPPPAPPMPPAPVAPLPYVGSRLPYQGAEFDRNHGLWLTHAEATQIMQGRALPVR